jgi:hypothetical protein
MSWKWQETMWSELDELEPLEQFAVSGEWITQMQQGLVPALAERRRAKLIEATEAVGGDYYLIAERIGSRKATVERLVNEGRAQKRGRDQYPYVE